MIIKINMQSEVPIYLQLRNEIVKGIGRGEFEYNGPYSVDMKLR